MSMTTELISELKELAGYFERKGFMRRFDLIRRTVLTIEEFSAKLQAANMERSSMYYHGGWIPCDERLPEEAYGCLVTVWDSTPTGEGDDFENILPYFVGYDGKRWNDADGQQCPFEVIAWMPLPEIYREHFGDMSRVD